MQKNELFYQYTTYKHFQQKGLEETACECAGRIYHHYKYFNQQIPQEMQETFLQPISKQLYEKIYKNMRNYYEKTKQ